MHKMEPKYKRKIFIALGGLNPQIITEGIFCLSVLKKIKFDRIIIFTTDECRSRIEKSLQEHLPRMEKLYSISLPKEERTEIYSVSEEFAIEEGKNPFAEMVFKAVRDLTSSAGNVLYCLLSGGRKTMSVDLATAMTLFGRKDDKMYHILVDKNFELKGWFFPEELSDAKQLNLVEKPFIKLRDKFLQVLPELGYTETINFLQNEIDGSLNLMPLEFIVKERVVKIGGKRLELPPLQYAIYLFFASEKKFILGGKNFSRTNSEKLWKLYSRVSSSYGHMERVRRFGYQNGQFDFEIIQKAISNIRRKVRNMLANNPIADYYVISVKGSYGKKMYGIELPSEKIKIVKNEYDGIRRN